MRKIKVVHRISQKKCILEQKYTKCGANGSFHYVTVSGWTFGLKLSAQETTKYITVHF